MFNTLPSAPPAGGASNALHPNLAGGWEEFRVRDQSVMPCVETLQDPVQFGDFGAIEVSLSPQFVAPEIGSSCMAGSEVLVKIIVRLGPVQLKVMDDQALQRMLDNASELVNSDSTEEEELGKLKYFHGSPFTFLR